MIKNVDENLWEQKYWIENQKNLNLQNLPLYNKNIGLMEVRSLGKVTFSTENIYDENEQENIKNRTLNFYKTKNGKIYKITLQRSLVESEDILKTIFLLQFLLFFLVAASLLLINRNVEKKVLIPFHKILESLRKYQIEKDSEVHFQNSKISEIQSLNISVIDLVERNKKQFLAQKEFTENASHELQTPLAIIRNKIELLLQTENISEEQMEILGEIYDTNHRLSKLNKSLLLLSKLDNRQFQEGTTINVSVLARKILDDFKEISLEKNLKFVENLKVEKTIFADKNLARILLGNLVSNAVKYALPNSEIKIKLTEQYFQISNFGSAEKLDEKLLFKRFQKQTSEKSGNGLGLEISKKICEIYSWKLTYDFKNLQHTFKIEF